MKNQLPQKRQNSHRKIFLREMRFLREMILREMKRLIFLRVWMVKSGVWNAERIPKKTAPPCSILTIGHEVVMLTGGAGA